MSKISSQTVESNFIYNIQQNNVTKSILPSTMLEPKDNRELIITERKTTNF
jgi:hypothetical protein